MPVYNGYTASAQNYTGGVAGTTFWELTPSTTNMDSWGHTIDETLGTTTAVRIQSAYDAVTSWATTRTVGSGGSLNNIQNLAYQWDLNGNLGQRQDIIQSLTEVFNYDNLNRLQTSTLNSTQNLSLAIDATGNITSRTEGGVTYPYTYDTTHTHAVHTVGSSPNQTTFTYDANGNMATRNGNGVTWASYNLPTSITGPNNTSASFYYGPDRQRKEQDANYVVDGENGLEQTIYVFGLYEFESTPAQSHNKYFIAVPGGTQIVYDIQSVNGAQTTYITADHLGSGNVFLTSSGAVSIKESYSAYGYRRSSNWSGPLSNTSSDYTTIASTTRRGYTSAFHEMLDNLGLIHMNGRVYDPVIGRFLSPDAVITQLGDSQRGNPYSYVENRPLTMTDPTGLKICDGDFCNDNQTPLANGCATGCQGAAAGGWGSVGAGADMMDNWDEMDLANNVNWPSYTITTGPVAPLVPETQTGQGQSDTTSPPPAGDQPPRRTDVAAPGPSFVPTDAAPSTPDLYVGPDGLTVVTVTASRKFDPGLFAVTQVFGIFDCAGFQCSNTQQFGLLARGFAWQLGIAGTGAQVGALAKIAQGTAAAALEQLPPKVIAAALVASGGAMDSVSVLYMPATLDAVEAAMGEAYAEKWLADLATATPDIILPLLP